MDHEDAKKVVRSLMVVHDGSCSSCVSDALDVLITELPQFDWVEIAKEVSQEPLSLLYFEDDEELLRFEDFEYVGVHRG